MSAELFPRRVTVFVDHYVRGELPPRCVLTGVPTEVTVHQRTRIGGPSPVWLLALLFGPVGLVVLLVAFAVQRGEVLSGSLPVSEQAYARHQRIRRTSLGAALAGLVLALVWLFGSSPVWTVPGVVGVVMFGGGLVVRLMAERRWPHLELDATRRWLTISRAHPDFVAEVRARAGTYQG